MGTFARRSAKRSSPEGSALKVATAYFVFGAVWTVVGAIAIESTGRVGSVAVPIKAAALVLLTSFLIFIYVRRMIRTIDEQHEKEMRTKLDLVNRLALAAEYRDDLKGGHNTRIGMSSMIIAEELGVPRDQCDLISQAALLHDIGKIGIPDSILSKPGPLTPQERRQMEKHVLYGAHLLDGSEHELMQMARVIALTHHERWNGTGYPYALRESEIPLEGRIVAVCDVFDALTSERSYKEAWPVESAREFIVEQSGEMFDPRVVTAFDARLHEIVLLKQTKGPGSTETLSFNEPETALWKQAVSSLIEPSPID